MQGRHDNFNVYDLMTVQPQEIFSGIPHPLCVVEELDPNLTQSVHASIVFGGFSLCRHHFTVVTDMIRAGIPMGEVVHTMMSDGFPSPDDES